MQRKFNTLAAEVLGISLAKGMVRPGGRAGRDDDAVGRRRGDKLIGDDKSGHDQQNGGGDNQKPRPQAAQETLLANIT